MLSGPRPVPAGSGGSVVSYEALLTFTGLGRLAEPLMQYVFNRVGAKAKAGLESALNPSQ